MTRILSVSRPDQSHIYQPLLINPITHEPYLRLPAPYSNIIFTPPRDSDAADMVPHLNDPAVHRWLTELPSPYTLEHAQNFLENHGMKAASHALRNLEESDGKKEVLIEGLVVNSLREVKDDGSEVYIGNISIRRCPWMQYCDGATMDDKESLEEENNRLPLGDPNILWTYGNYLAPSHHRRGITTVALQTLLHQWAIPKMGIRRILASAFEGNYGSVKVMQNKGSN